MRMEDTSSIIGVLLGVIKTCTNGPWYACRPVRWRTQNIVELERECATLQVL
jgi:hypothetical protein